MIKKYIAIIFISCIFFINGVANKTDNGSLFLQANEAYSKSSYDSAIVLYNQILESGYEAAEVYYNLGNAYFKTKQIPRAILNYERAVQLEPNNEDFQFNLQLAQTMIIDKINVLPKFFLAQWWGDFSLLLSSNSWAMLSIVLFIMVLAGLLVYLFTKTLWIKKLSFYTACLLFTGSIIAFSHSHVQKSRIENHSSAIVMTPAVNIKSSPDAKGTDIFVLHEGVKVLIIDEVGEWIKIKIADGNSGWLMKKDVERI